MANFPGTDGSDTLEGTSEADTISGEGGNDRLRDARDGSDLIDGGDGDDEISLHRLYQTGGSVTLLGGNGADKISVSAPSGGDLFLTIDSGAGDDHVTFGELRKAATVTLGAGRDVVSIGAYQSIYLGPETNITFTDFEAGANGDRLDWEWFLGTGQTTWSTWDRQTNPFTTGHLRLVQTGADVALQIDRDGGGDLFVTFMTFANASLASFTHHNFGGWEPTGTITVPLALNGSAVADELFGGGGNDILTGLGGMDELFGGGGDDILDGGEESDRLSGSFGNDLLLGRGGSDWLSGSFGDDVAYGGLGNDYFENIEGGRDAFFGEEGNDSFWMEPGFYSAEPDSYYVDGGIGNDWLVVDSYSLDDHLNADMGAGDDYVHLFIFRGLGTITLGSGRDILEMAGATPHLPDSTIVVTDFAAGAAGDTLKWLPVLDTVAPTWDNTTDPFATGFARLVQQGSATLLQIDKDGPDGGSNGFATLLTLLGTTASALQASNIGFVPAAIVTAAAPVAANDSFSTNEAGVVTGNVLADNGAGADTSDVNGIALIAAVNGYAGMGLGFLLPSGAVVTIDVKGNFIYDPNGAFDHLAAWGTGGSNSQAQDSFTYTLAGGGTGTVTVTVRGLYSSPHEILGTAGADVLTGTALADIFSPGAGADQMTGGAGDDIYFIDTMGDVAIEGAGAGTDEVRTALGSKTDHSLLYVLPANIENLTGTSATGLGQGVRGNALNNVVTMGGGSDLIVLDDGGNDTAAAGGGDDFVYFGGAWTALDSVDGGTGFDTVAVLGTYTVTLTSGSLVGVERLALYTGLGAPSGTANSYNITTVDENVASGAELSVTAASLKEGETLIFNGAAETNGRFSVLGGAGGDIVAGGAKADYLAGRAGDDQLFGLGGNDTLVGGSGADTLRGGGGRDVFRYESTGDSIASAMDRILDFGAGGEADRIDLSAIDAKTGTAVDDAFTFIGTNAAFSGAGGELRVTKTGGNWFVEADVDGDKVADLVIRIENGAGHLFAAGDFVL